MHTYLKAFNHFMASPEAQAEATQAPDEHDARVRFSQFLSLGFSDPDSRIIQLDKDMIPLLEDTDPDFEDLHLPYPAMFINHQFTIGKFRINGFMLIDLDAFERKGFTIQRSNSPHALRVLAVVLNTDNNYEFYSIEPLIKKVDRTKQGIFAYDVGEVETMAEASDIINRISANLINLIINDEKDIVQVMLKADPEQNKKRIKRGKLPHWDKLVIRLGDTLRAYARAYSEHRGTIDIRFLVRGHFMRFKAMRYTQARGTKKWVLPFYKGEGTALYSSRVVEIKNV